ncbi:MAG: TIGR04076 family protein [Oscillospiraceae bacterium]
MRRVKITVLRKEFYPDYADAYLTDGKSVGACPLLEVGDEFIFDGNAKMPNEFCPWASIDIYRNASSMSSGSSCKPWNNKDGQTIVCYTDGIRPVVFDVKTIGDNDDAIQ